MHAGRTAPTAAAAALRLTPGAAGPCAPPCGSCHSVRGIKGDAGRAADLPALRFLHVYSKPPGGQPGRRSRSRCVFLASEKRKSELERGRIFQDAGGT